VDPPWDVADDAARRAGVELRILGDLEDCDAVNAVIAETWGPGSELPRELVRAFQAGGDPPIGALAGGRLVGFALGFVGPDPDGFHVHSHMLAVLPERRAAGVGYALKLGQRAAALDAGIHVMRWTFDPMQARNAYFNLVKLGVVADRFHRHFYGEMGDALNAGQRSDRLEARWDLDREPGPRDEEAAATTRVDVPSDYPELRRRDPARAAALREEVAGALEEHLGAGLVAVGFLREGAYLLGPEPGR
jgi:predicted GNAT superfamily acetyltransferase